MDSVYYCTIEEIPLKNWNKVPELRVSTTQQLLSPPKFSVKWKKVENEEMFILHINLYFRATKLSSDVN